MRGIHSFVPVIMIGVHYGLVINFEDQATLPEKMVFMWYYALMCLGAFFGSMFWFWPGGTNTGISCFQMLWTLVRSFVVMFEFIAWTYVRAKPFKFYEQFNYHAASALFWIAGAIAVFFSFLTVMFPSYLAISPVDNAMKRLQGEYGRVTLDEFDDAGDIEFAPPHDRAAI